MLKLKISFFIIYLLTFKVYGQTEIPIIKKGICDSLSTQNTEVKSGRLICLNYSGKDEVLYFTSNKEFEQYFKKNTTSEKCIQQKEMKFDLKNNNLLIIKLAAMGCQLPEHPYHIEQKGNHYNINLNFIALNPVGAVQFILYSYVLVPKKMGDLSEFTICKTFKN